MKKGLLFPAALLAALSLFAQPTLQNNVIPNIGDFVYSATADSNSAQPGNAGANQTWNFGGMQAQDPPTLSLYVSPVGTPYAGDFPTATLVTKVGSGDTAIYAYSREEANQFLTLGTRGNGFSLDYSNPDAQLKYPTNFNGTYDDAYTYVTDAGTGFNYVSNGSRTVKYDAYGTLTTPLGTFQNAIRIKGVSTQLDSVNAFGTILINHTDITTYGWLVPNHPGNLVSINYVHVLSETRLPGIDTIINESGPFKTVTYISTATTGVFSAPDAPAGLTITALGPNPAVDQLSLRFTATDNTHVLNLLVTDMNGRVVKTQVLVPVVGENDCLIPVGQLAAGTYQITLLDGKNVLTKSWVKQ